MTTVRPSVSQVWASAATSADIQDPDKFSAGKVNQGWVAEIPPYQWFNWILQRNDEFKRSLVERGIAAWGTDVTYEVGALSFNDEDNTIYTCIKSNIGIRPDLDTGKVYWVRSAIQVTLEEFDKLNDKLNKHVENFNNPHNVTAAQIGAYTSLQIDALLKGYSDSFNAHLKDFNNPHKVTAEKAGAVPITGGTYTGKVNFAQNTLNIGGATSGISSANGLVSIFNNGNALGVDSSGKVIFRKGSTDYEILTTDKFAQLTLDNNPKYAVPIPTYYLPLNGDTCIYEGEGTTTFSRASRSTYIDYLGLPAFAEIDEPRFNTEGILMENITANQFINSNVGKSGYVCSQGSSVIVDDTPWGIINMTRFNTSNSAIKFVDATLPVDKIRGLTLCTSFYIRKRSADTKMQVYVNQTLGYLDVFFDDSKNTGKAHSALVAPNTYRVWVTHTFANDETHGIDLNCKCGTGDALGGRQIEIGTHPSSWIPTTDTSATRPADSFWIEPSIGTSGDFTASFTCGTLLDIPDRYKTIFQDSTTGLAAWVDKGYVNFRTAAGKVYSLKQFSRLCRYTFSYNATNVSIYADGVLMSSYNDSGHGSKYNEFGKTYLGNASASIFAIEGTVRDLRIWHEYLNKEQCSTL